MAKTAKTIRVFNTHTARVAGVPPQEEGRVPEWIADQFKDSHLRRMDAPPAPPAEDPEEVHHRTAVRLIKEATEYAQVEPFLEDNRPSVKAAAEKRVQELEA